MHRFLQGEASVSVACPEHVPSSHLLLLHSPALPSSTTSGNDKTEKKMLTHEQEAILNRIKTMSLLDYTGVDVNLHHMLSSI